jgi:D-alanyl-D-alanine carboxypeptidase/D-alanyl-D-alanine-endopeptidase (penicillin-binding protein 4)
MTKGLGIESGSKHALAISIMFSIFLLLTPFTLTAQSASPYAGVKKAMQAITDHKDLKHAQWGFVLQDLETGKTVLEHRPGETMLPASTMKTVTSAAALGILGEDYTFKTRLEIDGKVENGVLKGNVIVRGGGDPSLGSDRFSWGTDMEGVLAIWVKMLRQKGIRKVDGMVIGDASIFEDAMLATTWVWSDIGNYYGSGACGLSFNENTYYVYFKPHATVGQPAELLRTEPDMPDIDFINEMKTGARGSGDQGYIYGSPYTYLRYLRGSIPQGKPEFSIKGSLPDPALYTAQRLRAALLADSVQVSGEAETIRRLRLDDKLPEGERTVIHTHKSPPLKDIVYWLNKKSINLYAEHLVKIIGYEKYKDGSTASGTKAIADYWRQKGLVVDGLHMKDGSGLSRYNGVTPAQLCGMLRINHSQKYFQSFFHSLPIAGLSSDPGTLRRMCRNTSAANNLRAKSGYISRVRAYTGYVDSKSGKPYCFAMMANNYTCSNREMRDLFEALMVAMAEIP